MAVDVRTCPCAFVFISSSYMPIKSVLLAQCFILCVYPPPILIHIQIYSNESQPPTLCARNAYVSQYLIWLQTEFLGNFQPIWFVVRVLQAPYGGGGRRISFMSCCILNTFESTFKIIMLKLVGLLIVLELFGHIARPKTRDDDDDDLLH